MKLYIFTADTNYGEFVKIIAAKSLTEAYELGKLGKLGWDKKDGKELVTPNEPEIVFDGGGSH